MVIFNIFFVHSTFFHEASTQAGLWHLRLSVTVMTLFTWDNFFYYWVPYGTINVQQNLLPNYFLSTGERVQCQVVLTVCCTQTLLFSRIDEICCHFKPGSSSGHQLDRWSTERRQSDTDWRYKRMMSSLWSPSVTIDSLAYFNVTKVWDWLVSINPALA